MLLSNNQIFLPQTVAWVCHRGGLATAMVKRASYMLAHEENERRAVGRSLVAAAHAPRLVTDPVVRSTVMLHDQPILRCPCVHSPCRLE